MMLLFFLVFGTIMGDHLTDPFYLPDSFIENFKLSSDYESLEEDVEYFNNFGDINIRS